MVKLSGVISNVSPSAAVAPRPWAFCTRIFTCPPGAVTDANIGRLGSPDPRVYVHVQPEGATWEDGSYRFLRCEFLVRDLLGPERLAVDIEELSALPSFQFELSDWAYGVALQAPPNLPAPDYRWRAGVRTPIRVQTQCSFRMGDFGSPPWWVEVTYDAIHKMDSVPFRCRIGWHNQTVPDMKETLPHALSLLVPQPALVAVRGAAGKGISVRPVVGGPGYVIDMLPTGSYVVDAQSIAFRGVICFLPREVIAEIRPGESVTPETAAMALGRLIATGRAPAGALERLHTLYAAEMQQQVRCVQVGIQDGWAPNPLPYLGAQPPGMAPNAGTTWARVNSAPLLPGSPFQPPRLGHQAAPEGTGSQIDLGLQRTDPMLQSPDAAIDEVIAQSVEFEAGRPSHYRDDLDPLWPGLHPNLRIWYGRPHFSTSESPDRLGKGSASLPTAPAGLEQRGWEHFTINYMFAAWLTGDELCADLLADVAKLWAMSAKGLTPPSFLNSPGAARHTARFIWSGLQLHMARGPLPGHLDLCHFRANAARPSTGPVGTVLAVRGPAQNFLPTRDSWIAYEESDAAVSLYALAQFLRSIDAAEANRLEALAYDILSMVVRFGFSWATGSPVPATAVAWNGGVELTPAQLEDPAWRSLYPRSDYQWWILPGVLLMRKLCAPGQPRENAALWAEADRTIKAVLASRRSSSTWDDKSGWLSSVPLAEQV